MLSADQVDFYIRWRAKAESVSLNNIEDCIDKYVTLFITYNALYDTVPEKAAIHKGKKVKNIGDAESATTSIRDFLGGPSILSTLKSSNNDRDVTELLAAMKMFNIAFKQGKHRPDIDQQLEHKLASEDQDVKALGLLEVLYYVRCNIVHGRKGLLPYQMVLLLPAINLLTTLNSHLFTKLNSFPI